jgi:hypothetical protein
LRGDDAKGYKISVCFKNKVSHYRIRQNTIGKHTKYNVDDSEIFFDSIITLIEYYHFYSEALCTKLLRPCPANLMYSKVNSIAENKPTVIGNLGENVEAVCTSIFRKKSQISDEQLVKHSENKTSLFINMLSQVVGVLERQSLDEFNLQRMNGVVTILTNKINNT